ncbi:hypothetical protein O3P69_019033 [Scylla paramamosain]|uniref:Uncharacterized protein n=1 Tax=Scylla paramamosain TaxID=85552 RepID=A0AAW0T6W7_SCYPA
MAVPSGVCTCTFIRAGIVLIVAVDFVSGWWGLKRDHARGVAMGVVVGVVVSDAKGLGALAVVASTELQRSSTVYHDAHSHDVHSYDPHSYTYHK